MRTVLALLLSAALVTGAVVYRGARDDGAGLNLGSREPLELICATEVAQACRALAEEDDGLTVRVEEAGTTAQALSSATDVEADGWLVPAPFPEIAAENRNRAGAPPLPEPDGTVLARSPVLLAVPADRGAVLDAECDMVGWACVGDVAGGGWADAGGQTRWGPVKPGYPDPGTSATGLLVAAQGTADFFDRPEFGARDLQLGEFQDWAGRLDRSVRSHGGPTSPPLQQMVQAGPAQYDVTGALEAQAAPLFERSASRVEQLGLELRLPEPVVTADVVLAPLRTESAGRLRDSLSDEAVMEALGNSGWRVEGGRAPAASPASGPLPEGSGLPAPGVMEALRIFWDGIVR